MSIENESVSEPDFGSLPLIESLHRAISDAGYEKPSPIQALTIPPLLEGRDLVGQAQTGTGKTAAFALPLLSRIDLKVKSPQVLVLAPTRELAMQVAESFKKYAAHMKGFKVLPVYGGSSYDVQFRALDRGVHVVVGTPGRVMDHMRRGSLKLDALSCMVLDEADEMLRMGFIDDVEWVLEQTPEGHQTALFSATMPPAIRNIAKRFLNEPEEISIKTRTTAADSIRQRHMVVGHLNKTHVLTRLLEVETFDGMIVFVKTKTGTMSLAEELDTKGFNVAPLNGDISQDQRERTVDRFKRGKLDVLVATDVAARGLDVERISHVINYDMPHDAEGYVHRIGRTGRAGRTGEAISFFAPREKFMVGVIQRATKQPIHYMELPTIKEINAKRVERFTQRITDAMAAPDLEFFEELLKQYQREQNVSPLTMAAALAKMAQGEESLILKDEPRRQVQRDNTFERGARPGQDRPFRKKKAPSAPEEGMERYRVEVGYQQGINPGNIVGAIANEADLSSKFIGRIDIFDDFSTVDLPAGMPKEIYRSLKQVYVGRNQLKISKFKHRGDPPPRPAAKHKKSKKKVAAGARQFA